MEPKLLATYPDVYHYFELYEECLQIHQNKTGTIPFPAILKNDGEKFPVNQIKQLSFHRELGHIEGVEIKDYHTADVEMIYICEILFTKRKKITLKSKISATGWGERNQPDLFREFMDSLLPLVDQNKVNLKGSTGLSARQSKVLKRFKIGSYIAGGGFVISVLLGVVEEVFLGFLYDEYGVFSVAVFLALLAIILLGIRYFVFEKYLKKNISVKEVIREYLPPLSLEAQERLKDKEESD